MPEARPNSTQEQIAVVLLRPRGGVAPSRHEVALADYIEKQSAYRRPASFSLGNARVATVLWNLIRRACLASIRVLPPERAVAQTGPCHGTMGRHGSSAGGSAYGH
jgi:hypothetical protein